MTTSQQNQHIPNWKSRPEAMRAYKLQSLCTSFPVAEDWLVAAVHDNLDGDLAMGVWSCEPFPRSRVGYNHEFLRGLSQLAVRPQSPCPRPHAVSPLTPRVLRVRNQIPWLSQLLRPDRRHPSDQSPASQARGRVSRQSPWLVSGSRARARSGPRTEAFG